MEKTSELEIVKLTDGNYMGIVERCIEFGEGDEGFSKAFEGEERGGERVNAEKEGDNFCEGMSRCIRVLLITDGRLWIIGKGYCMLGL